VKISREARVPPGQVVTDYHLHSRKKKQVDFSHRVRKERESDKSLRIGRAMRERRGSKPRSGKKDQNGKSISWTLEKSRITKLTSWKGPSSKNRQVKVELESRSGRVKEQEKKQLCEEGKKMNEGDGGMTAQSSTRITRTALGMRKGMGTSGRYVIKNIVSGHQPSNIRGSPGKRGLSGEQN